MSHLPWKTFQRKVCSFSPRTSVPHRGGRTDESALGLGQGQRKPQLAMIKKRLEIDASLYTVSQTTAKNLFEEISLDQLFIDCGYKPKPVCRYKISKQDTSNLASSYLTDA